MIVKNDFTKLIVEKTKKLKIGNGMDENVVLGPLTTKKRLDEIEDLVDVTKKEGLRYYVEEKNHQDLIKDIFMNLRYLMMYKIILQL